MPDRVLIVDDSVSMRQMTGIILSSAGYEVVQAEDGNDGLSKLTEDIRVVLTDYNMPTMNGLEFIRAVRSGTVNKSVPIIMVTTESEDDKKRAGKEAGATGWITKPFQKETLLAAVKKVAARIEF